MRKGAIYAGSAFLLWGVLPLYLKLLQSVPPGQILAHRIVWSLLLLLVILLWRGQWDWLKQCLREPRILTRFFASAALIALNWFLYIWAINNDRVVDASLGYFINPLVNVMLGFLVLHERLRARQWAAIGLAALGVVWLTWQTHQLPWIALLLAVSFGTYGLLRKTAALGALEGLSVETLLLTPFALGYLIWLGLHGQNAFLASSVSMQFLLAAAGPVTAVPLLLFAAGARRIPLSLLGILQYIGPSLQLLIGVLIFHEPFNTARLVGFALIWAALALYTLEGWVFSRSQARLLAAANRV